MDVHLTSALINFYGRCWRTDYVDNVFDEMPKRGVALWNEAIIAALQNENYVKALQYFKEMQFSIVKGDCFTIAQVLHGCAKGRALDEGVANSWAKIQLNPSSITPAIKASSELNLGNLGKQMHCYVLSSRLDYGLYVQTTLLDMYVKIDELAKAQSMFDRMKTRNIVAWNSLISGYSSKGLFDDTLRLLNQMEKGAINPDLVTWNSVLYGYSLKGCVKDALAVLEKILGIKRFKATQLE